MGALESLASLLLHAGLACTTSRARTLRDVLSHTRGRLSALNAQRIS